MTVNDLDGDVDSTDNTLATALIGTTLVRGVLSRSDVQNRYGYAGYRFDEAVLKYHVRNRVYDPWLGRWSRRDPIGYMAGTMNLYEPLLSNPIYNVDPFGLDIGNLPNCPYKKECRDRGINPLTGIPYTKPPRIPSTERLPAWLEWDNPVTNSAAWILNQCCDQDYLAGMSNDEIYGTSIAVGVAGGIASAPAVCSCEIAAWAGIKGGELYVRSPWFPGRQVFFRFNPFGDWKNLGGCRLPHWHFRNPFRWPPRPGGGIGRHLPWDWWF